MIFEKTIARWFVCSCSGNYPIKMPEQMQGNKFVAKCSNCNKRVYGRILFYKDDVNSGVSEE